MWARRCGAPPRWPSRVKVGLQSFMTAGIGLTIYEFMAGGDVGYLDVFSPESEQVLCLTRWPLRNQMEHWLDDNLASDWVGLKYDMEEYLRELQCAVPALANASCMDTAIPLHAMQRKLGAPMGLGVGHNHDVLDMYSHLFLWLTLLLWLSLTTHDCALLHTEKKDFILDWGGLNKRFPMLRQSCHLARACNLTSCKILQRLAPCACCYKTVVVVFHVLMWPLLVAWSLVVFLLVVCPLAAVLFLCYPVRTSRFLVFFLCLATGIYGLCLTVHQLVFLADSGIRPRYAVTWGVDVDQSQRCICGCSYPISASTCQRLLVVGLIAVIKSLLVAFRTLKGLRRSQWANLMTVTFAVPMAVYDVQWKRPDGSPIQHRKEGEPVQGELAFDPFALMDEQPDSAMTTLTLKPVAAVESVEEEDEEDGTRLIRRWAPRYFTRKLEGPQPKIPEHIPGVELQETEYIGCCGFPCVTGGWQAVLASESEDDEEEQAQQQQSLQAQQQQSLQGVQSTRTGSSVAGTPTDGTAVTAGTTATTVPSTASKVRSHRSRRRRKRMPTLEVNRPASRSPSTSSRQGGSCHSNESALPQRRAGKGEKKQTRFADELVGSTESEGGKSSDEQIATV